MHHMISCDPDIIIDALAAENAGKLCLYRIYTFINR